MSIEISGPTMGTTWAVALRAGPVPATLVAACQAAVDQVDQQMSTWRPDSDLMRFNAAPLGQWHDLPPELMQVLAAGLQVSAQSGGAFEMNIGRAVRAWGFSADTINLDAIRAASAATPIKATEALDLSPPKARKTQPLSLELSGIAKGFGVDQLIKVVKDHGIDQALCSIDGEVRALGAWHVAIEAPDSPDRASHSMLVLQDAALATSGDYRHFVTVKGTRLSHTMDPRRGAPLTRAPASVTVLAASCIRADALATALMVMGAEQGMEFARAAGISALFLIRTDAGLRAVGTAPFVSD